MVVTDSDYFQELQTHTGWGRTLFGFAVWCDPQPGWLTLDVGCGPGLLPSILSKLSCTAIGVDLDVAMFKPPALHAMLAVADVHNLPFEPKTFDLITASNLIFLLPEPDKALLKLKPLLVPKGKLVMLNPSELLSHQAALNFAVENRLEGLARDTLLNWASRAEQHHRWTDEETRYLYAEAGFTYQGSKLKVGPGFARFSSGIA
jgi:SAM-dependent methyltransferase